MPVFGAFVLAMSGSSELPILTAKFGKSGIANEDMPLSEDKETHMAYRVEGIDPTLFQDLIGRPDDALSAMGVTRWVVDANPGFPDRIEVRDLDVGETALLFSYEHQPADTAYRSRHAIFIGEASRRQLDLVDELPQAILSRPISLRAFDAQGQMLDADLADGTALTPLIERFLSNPQIAYLHAHYAKRGCYAARITRA